MMRRVHRDPLSPLVEPFAPRHRPGVRANDRAHDFGRNHREVQLFGATLSPTFYASFNVGPQSWRQRHSNPRRRRAPRAPMREVKRRSNHSERHFGARGPLLRGNEVSRPLLAQRPLLHADLHLHDRERRGQEVSAVFAGESFTGSAGGDRWPSSSQVLEWARKRTKQLAGA